MYDIVVSEFVDQWAVDDLAKDYKVHYDRTLVSKPEELAKLAAESPAIIVRNLTQVRGPVLAAMKNLKVIGRLGVGLDNIDMEECARRGIQVFPATGANTVSVAEYVIGAILVGLRDVWKANADVLAGKWPRNDLMLGEAYGKRLGFVGFGGIARATAVRAKALEMDLAAYDPMVKADDPAWKQYGVARIATLDELAATCDVISLHVPLTPETRNMFDAGLLAKMKKTALLINTARGGIIDEAALAAALKAGTIGGALIDVYDKEPLKAGSALEGAPRLWLTPHIAGVTAEGNVRVSSVTVANVRGALAKLGIKGSK
ncbi:MAG: 3-phosphoglycerate dehydrogenase [Alphaproteobacteria bacterium]|nr:3-phosphoglycerate dehydrogenase [Alphaproteobacteria bacterium]